MAASAPRLHLPVPYRISVVTILLCGAVTAAFVFRDARRGEDDSAEADFARRSAQRHALTREILGRYSESLFGLSALFTVDPNVTRAAFSDAAARLEQRLSGALAFEWVPVVPAARRAEVEAAIGAMYPERKFEFTDLDASGQPHRAGDRPVYFPLCYIEPLHGNAMALGYDVGLAATRPFLDRARGTGDMVVTGKIRLVQDPTGEPAVVMIWPVYRREKEAPRERDAAPACIGFVQCLFRVQQLLETASGTQGEQTLDMLFIDGSETDPSRRCLYFRPAGGVATAEPPPAEDEFERDAPFSREFTLPFGDRDWRVLYRPRRDSIEGQHTTGPLLRASSVMLFTAMLAGLVTVIGRRTETIRRQVEQRTAELAESRRQFANLLHALPGMAYRGTYDHTLRVTFASEGALALTGYTAEEITSGTVQMRDLIHPDDVERVREATRVAMTEHRDFEIEYRIHARSGELKWALSRGRGVYDAAGRLQFMEGLIIDISVGKRAEADRLAIERKLLETQKLESLGLLAGGIAHDFNNLLSAILGNANLARLSIEPGNPVDAQLRAIETASLRAAELCRQMLAYAGKGRFIIERVDLSLLIDELLPLLRVSIAQSATLHLQLENNLPAIKADATQLRQIVMNLVLNAVDSLSGRGGDITLRTGVAAVDSALLARCATGNGLPAGEYVFLDVIDTGCGMSADVVAKIFDPFFTTKFAGRGLGLAAVLGIVRSHNGALLVESSPGAGSTFRLFLPRAGDDAPKRTPAAATPASGWRHGGDVLVIDDDEAVRVVLASVLRTFGLNAEVVADGRAGVEAFRKEPARWTLVMLDVLMPGMSGEETLQAIRSIRPDVPVLMISGYAGRDVEAQLRHKGGRIGFLPKPFNHEVLAENLRRLVSN